LKRKDLVRELVRSGCFLLRRGSRHDIYMNRQNGKKAPVPRHKEIKDSLCVLIKGQLGVK
jgi:hypothetical protein